MLRMRLRVSIAITGTCLAALAASVAASGAARAQPAAPRAPVQIKLAPSALKAIDRLEFLRSRIEELERVALRISQAPRRRLTVDLLQARVIGAASKLHHQICVRAPDWALLYSKPNVSALSPMDAPLLDRISRQRSSLSPLSRRSPP